MNKIIIFFIVTLFSVNVKSQSQHLKFKEIPINGNLSEFITKMKVEGFVLKEVEGNIAIMSGLFVGKKSDIYIVASPKSKTVWKVSVNLPDESTWYSLKSSYNTFKSQFSKKYGDPTESYEFFSKPYYEGDSYEMQALSLEKCNYYSYWENDLGIISIELSKIGRAHV